MHVRFLGKNSLLKVYFSILLKFLIIIRLSEERGKIMACEANQKPTAGAELNVNGKEIELNNFAQNFISQTVIGMVKSLRGIGDIETIDLKVSKKVK